MIAVDTNILARFYCEDPDDPEAKRQRPHARRVMIESSAVFDDLAFPKHVDYVHWNPVKHAYVIRVANWPYSSFHRYVRRGLYPLTWASHAEDDAGRYGGAL